MLPVSDVIQLLKEATSEANPVRCYSESWPLTVHVN